MGKKAAIAKTLFIAGLPAGGPILTIYWAGRLVKSMALGITNAVGITKRKPTSTRKKKRR